MATDRVSEVLIEKHVYLRHGKEERIAATVARARGIEFKLSSLREANSIAAHQPYAMAVGTVPFVLGVLRAARLQVPQHVPYPSVLSAYLHRKVGYAERLKDLLQEKRGTLFVKPAKGWKNWTGEVMDARHPRGRNAPVYWSEPVSWLSEWRAYVVRGRVLDIQPAPGFGEAPVACDQSVVAAAALELHASTESADGVVIDFGVLSTGVTALIEVNDGFSFGAYGSVSDDTMWAVWEARWLQLAGAARGETPSHE